MPNLSRNYLLLLASQFLSAFGDNVILAVIIGQLTFLKRDGHITDDQLRTYNTLCTSILFIPYILLAPVVGFLNDRYAKTRWLTGGNLIKLLGTGLAAISVWQGFVWQAAGYFVVGIGSSLYSPAKYGILPEILPRERLVKANGTVEVLTLLAILAGPLTGAYMVDQWKISHCYLVVLGIFGTSFLLNLFMTPTPETPGLHFSASVGEFFSNFRELFHSPRLLRVLLGTGVFWVCGAVLKMNFQPWGLEVLHFKSNTQIALLGLWLGIGIMGGSVLAGQLHKVGDLRGTALYGGLLALLVGCLSLLTVPKLTIPFLIGIGAAAGLFLIPLNAALQAESHQDKLGKTIATQNFIDNIGMIAGGIYVMGGIHFHLGPQGIFVGLGIIIGLAALLLRIPKKSGTV